MYIIDNTSYKKIKTHATTFMYWRGFYGEVTRIETLVKISV